MWAIIHASDPLATYEKNMLALFLKRQGCLVNEKHEKEKEKESQ